MKTDELYDMMTSLSFKYKVIKKPKKSGEFLLLFSVTDMYFLKGFPGWEKHH